MMTFHRILPFVCGLSCSAMAAEPCASTATPEAAQLRAATLEKLPEAGILAVSVVARSGAEDGPESRWYLPLGYAPTADADPRTAPVWLDLGRRRTLRMLPTTGSDQVIMIVETRGRFAVGTVADIDAFQPDRLSVRLDVPSTDRMSPITVDVCVVRIKPGDPTYLLPLKTER